MSRTLTRDAPAIALRSILVVLTVLFWGAACADAEPYPSRPVTLVIPFPAGGTTDVVGRSVGRCLEKRLGQPFVMEYRPGVGTTFAAGAVARGAPDGYTVMLATIGTLAFAPALYDKLSYDPIGGFTHLGLMTAAPFVLVANPTLGVNTVGDLRTLLTARPDSVVYGSPGIGTSHHLTMELFKQQTGIELTHVPYRGVAQALIDLVAGRIGLMFTDAAPAMGFIREGQIKAIAVSSATRLEALPDVPTMQEAGLPDFDVKGWFALVAPPKLPAPLANALAGGLNACLRDVETTSTFSQFGIQVLNRSPADAIDYIRLEIARWGEVIRRAGIKGN